jgi:hypothetical protein
MDSEPEHGTSRRTVRREVIRTERVRREVTVRLDATRAMRPGAKLVIRGLGAKLRRRKVQLTLRSDRTRPPTVALSVADEAPLGSETERSR